MDQKVDKLRFFKKHIINLFKNGLKPVKTGFGQFLKVTKIDCCVFRPENGCSARHSLVKIDFLLFTKKYAKSCFSVKKLIRTSERHADHPFAGRNTQQLTNCQTNILAVILHNK